MKIPYKTEPETLVSMDHEQLITGDPDHVRGLIIGMVMSTDHDLALADLMIGRIREAKKAIESKYKGPVERAHLAHKKLTKERGEIITSYEWAENLLKDKMKGYNMEADRKALAEAEVTTTSLTPPKPRSPLKHTSFIEKWKYRITDQTKLPRNYMMPDEKRIAATVRSMGEMAKISGIQVFRDDEVRVKI